MQRKNLVLQTYEKFSKIKQKSLIKDFKLQFSLFAISNYAYFMSQSQSKMNKNFYDDQEHYMSIFVQQESQISNSLLAHDGLHSISQEEEFNIIDGGSMAPPEPTIKVQERSDSKDKDKRRERSNKKKIFYRDKMAELEKGMKKQEYNYGADYNRTTRGKSPIPRQQQLKRNRQSAKLSRQRKKQYVYLLEQKNAQKQKQIDDLKVKLRSVQQQRDKLKEDDLLRRTTFMLAKTEAYDRLSQLLKGQIKVQTDLKTFLNDMIKKYGSAGEERLATTDSYFRGIMDIIISDIHKYVLSCVLTSKGLFGIQKSQPIDIQITNILQISSQKKQILSQKYGKRFTNQCQLFKSLCQKFRSDYVSIQGQAKVIEKLFNDFRFEFTDQNLARALLWLEQNKYRKDVKRIKSFWIDCTEGSVETITEMNQTRKCSKISTNDMIAQSE